MTVAPRACPPETPPCDADREFWLQVRQGLIIQLAAIDKRLGLTSARPKRERPEKVRVWHNEDEAEYKTA